MFNDLDDPQVEGVVSPLRHAKPQRMLDPRMLPLVYIDYNITIDHIEALPEGWHTSADT